MCSPSKLVKPKIRQKLKWLVAMATYCWRDSRLSLAARILIFLAPLYFICPIDFLPDTLPCGYLDDLLISPLLLVAAWCITPKILFTDARKSIRKKAAIIGTLYITALVPAQIRQSFSHSALVVSTQDVQMAIQPKAVKTVENKSQKSLTSNLTQIRFSKQIDSSAPEVQFCEASRMQNVISSQSKRQEPSFLLAHRGGQYQLYSSDDSSDSAIKLTSIGNLMLLTPLEGSIFVDLKSEKSHAVK